TSLVSKADPSRRIAWSRGHSSGHGEEHLTAERTLQEEDRRRHEPNSVPGLLLPSTHGHSPRAAEPGSNRCPILRAVTRLCPRLLRVFPRLSHHPQRGPISLDAPS